MGNATLLVLFALACAPCVSEPAGGTKLDPKETRPAPQFEAVISQVPDL